MGVETLQTMKLIMPLGPIPLLVMSVLLPCCLLVLYDKSPAVLLLAELSQAVVLLLAYKIVKDTFEYIRRHPQTAGSAMWI